MKKKTSFSTKGQRADIGDLTIYRRLANRYTDAVGPFVFLDHIAPKLHSSVINTGTGAHPHRGIATLSYIIEGEDEHFDSAGNYAKVFSGGIQWMKAGNGIMHDETLNVDSRQKNNRTHAFQFWINLPSKNKAEKPEYLAVAFDNGGSQIRNEMYPQYKANRDETPEPIRIAVPYIKEILKAMHIPVVEVPGIEADDLIVTEEPLQIRLQFFQNNEWIEKPISITMRTPGNDFELTLGFLYNESIINTAKDILQIKYCKTVKPEEKGNVVIVKLAPEISFDTTHLNRYFFTNSSCGICGKTAIEAVSNNCKNTHQNSLLRIDIETVWRLNDLLAPEQTIFNYTGGIHASALFTAAGELEVVKEDVGRHNALDKVIGNALLKELLPLRNNILFLSGRISFELVQKAIRAGISIVVAIGAPSGLAVKLAKENKVTIIGFLKKNGFNIYSHPERIIQ